MDFFQWFIKFLIRKISGSGIINENIHNKELAEKLYKPILEHLMEEKYTHLVWTIFGVQI